MARTVVWGHGLTSSMAKEDRTGLFRWVVPEGWELLRYDAAGHGTSEVRDRDPGRYRWERLAADMLARAPGSFVAAGASMGCATALYAALQAPERVEALVLVIPPTAWETRVAQRELYEATAHVAEVHGLARLRRLAAERPVPAIFAGHPELTAYDPHVAEDLLPSVLRGAAGSDLPPPDVLASLAQPALVLAWDTDPAHPVSTGARLGEVLPSATLHVADDLDAVRTWPTLVRDFLASLG